MAQETVNTRDGNRPAAPCEPRFPRLPQSPDRGAAATTVIACRARSGRSPAGSKRHEPRLRILRWGVPPRCAAPSRKCREGYENPGEENGAGNIRWHSIFPSIEAFQAACSEKAMVDQKMMSLSRVGLAPGYPLNGTRKVAELNLTRRDRA